MLNGPTAPRRGREDTGTLRSPLWRAKGAPRGGCRRCCERCGCNFRVRGQSRPHRSWNDARKLSNRLLGWGGNSTSSLFGLNRYTAAVRRQKSSTQWALWAQVPGPGAE